MTQVFDHIELLERVSDDIALLTQLFALYKKRSVELLAQLEQHAQASDTAAMAQHAHQLRGMLANMSGHKATQLAATLEDQAKRTELQHPLQQVRALAAAIGELTAALELFIGQQAQKNNFR